MWKKCARLRAGAEASRAFDFRFFVHLFRWKKVSLLTELENVPGWLSTKVSSLRDFYLLETRADKSRETGNLRQPPKTRRT
ncbi:MAG: hypothetical protein D6714_17125, partial [Bacteroidetes bacterium]